MTSALSPPPPPPPTGRPLGARHKRPIRSLLVVGRLTQIFLAVQVVFAALSTRALWRRADVIERFGERTGVGLRHIESADIRVLVTSILHTTTYLVAAVVFLTFFHAAYQNLETRGRARHQSGWALGAWFVPFLALWRPVKITEELLGADRSPATRVLLWSWWTLWVASTATWSVAFAIIPDEIDQFVAVDSWSAIGRSAHIAAGILLIVLVRRIMRADAAAAT